MKFLVHTPTWEEHVKKDVANVFCRLQKYNLKIQLRKCKWAKSKLKFLSFMISIEGIKMDPTKVLAIENFPVPKNVK